MALKNKPKYPRVAQLKTADQLRSHLESLGISLDFAEEVDAAIFSKPWLLKSGQTIGNRFCILPMEGWDGTTDGKPSEHTKRRWRNFAISGAKLLWGCEAVAVSPDGRANPNQLMINEANLADFEGLFQMLQDEHQAQFKSTDDLYIGLQLTHSGRFCKPNDHHKMEPQILYHHPVLDQKFGLGEDYPLMTDERIDLLIEQYIDAAKLAQQAGFHFVDIKHCHGYLGHEFLSAYDRAGKYGGNFENRTRLLREVVGGIRAQCPGLEIGVRVSVLDFVPYIKGQDGAGVPATNGKYEHAFGADDTGLAPDYDEISQFMDLLQELGIELVCTTAGSPYYNPHLTRPALFPPSDGYQPPEDPIVGVARHIQITAEIKKRYSDLCIVGSGYSYLQEWLPHVGQQVLKDEHADFVGLGRMVLSYPELPADVLAGDVLKRAKFCRTFSDCTTAPRNGMISGCFPLDAYYKKMPLADELKTLKAEKL